MCLLHQAIARGKQTDGLYSRFLEPYLIAYKHNIWCFRVITHMLLPKILLIQFFSCSYKCLSFFLFVCLLHLDFYRRDMRWRPIRRLTQRWGGIFGAQRKGRVPLRTVQGFLPWFRCWWLPTWQTPPVVFLGKSSELLLDFALGDS